VISDDEQPGSVLPARPSNISNLLIGLQFVSASDSGAGEDPQELVQPQYLIWISMNVVGVKGKESLRVERVEIGRAQVATVEFYSRFPLRVI
jgi:hypothetical protein